MCFKLAQNFGEEHVPHVSNLKPRYWPLVYMSVCKSVDIYIYIIHKSSFTHTRP